MTKATRVPDPTLKSVILAAGLLGLMIGIAFVTNRLVYGVRPRSPVLTGHLRRRVRIAVCGVLIAWVLSSLIALALAASWAVGVLTLAMLAILAGCAWEFGRDVL